MEPWKTVKKEVVLELGTFLTVEDHTVLLPDGRVISGWPWIVTPDYITVMAVTDDGRFLIFRQTKYAVEGTSLAPVAGYLEPGEEPLAAAKRELLEETGYESPDWADLGNCRSDGNRGGGLAYFFLARGARRVAKACADDLEEQDLLLLNRREVEKALGEGEFKVLSWAAAVALGLLHLKDK